MWNGDWFLVPYGKERCKSWHNCGRLSRDWTRKVLPEWLHRKALNALKRGFLWLFFTFFPSTRSKAGSTWILVKCPALGSLYFWFGAVSIPRELLVWKLMVVNDLAGRLKLLGSWESGLGEGGRGHGAAVVPHSCTAGSSLHPHLPLHHKVHEFTLTFHVTGSSAW